MVPKTASISPSVKLTLVILLVVGTFLQSAAMFRSGLNYDYGLGFWGANGHDGIWHLALVNQIHNPFLIPHPALSGEYLQNYHPFYDITTAFVSKFIHLSSSLLIFQIFPIIFSFLLGLLSYHLGTRLTGNYRTGLLLMIFNYFAGSFGWIVTLIKDHTFYGESLFWAMQSASTQINPPFALSLVMLLLALLIIVSPRPSKIQFLALVIITSILPITKIYAGITLILLIALQVLLNHRKLFFIKTLVVSLPLSLGLFLIYNHGSTSLLRFQPLWFTHTLIESTDRFYLPTIASLRYNLHWYDPRYIAIELVSILIFIIGNFGLRMYVLRDLKLYFSKPIYLSIIIVVIATIAAPLLFVQEGTAWNTIQFLYYSLFFTNILLAVMLTKYFNLKLVILFVLFSIIGNIGAYRNFFGNPAPAALPPSEVNALRFLAGLPGHTVLTFPFDQFSRQSFKSTPLPLYAYETSAYVAAYSGKQQFLGDEMNLMISGYNFTDRRQSSLDFFQNKSIFQSRGLLVNNQIDYIYLTGPQYSLVLPAKELGINKIYDYDHTVIYQVLR